MLVVCINVSILRGHAFKAFLYRNRNSSTKFDQILHEALKMISIRFYQPHSTEAT